MADNYDDEDLVLDDICPEEMTRGMDEATKFVARTFLDESHYQTLHQSLSNSWDRYHSLSAAIKLMETYGVTMTKEEEKKLCQLDEVQQINKLVQKMPQQNNDQFQQFFLQLQLLVSTAMHVRQSLEQGRPDEVAAALEDAASTGISSYILNVAIVQAGSEVKTLKHQFQAWTHEADNRMGRLLRGQQDNITAQKQLAQAEAELAKQNGEQSAKSAKVVMNFSAKNDKQFKTIVLMGWSQATKTERLEKLLREEYGDRLKDLEDNLAKVKFGQVSKCENVVLKRIQQENVALLGIVWDTWAKDSADGAFERTNADKIKAMEERLAHAQESQKENAKKVLAGMGTMNDQGLLAAVLREWVTIRMESIRQKKNQEARALGVSKLDEFAKHKSEQTKWIISKLCSSTNAGMIHEVFTGWADFWAEKKTENDIAEKMAKSRRGLDGFSERNKASTGSLMNRASQHIVTMLLTRCMNAWRMDTTMERTVGTHQMKIEAKRGQLVGVQQMFRNFAAQLESGMNKSGEPNSARIFDNNSKKKQMARGNEGSVSLPDINAKQGSGRSGKDHSSGRGSKASMSGRSDKLKQGSGRSGQSPVEGQVA